MDTPALTIAMDSPIGRLVLHSDGSHLVGLDILPERRLEQTSHIPHETTDPVLLRAQHQLHEYFLGKRRSFDVPTATAGTPFQQKVWKALSTIDYGTTLTYRELGERAGVGNAPRAVGGAVGRNPIALIIPCHRVLGHSGAITGYSAGEGTITKAHLLDLEGIPYTSITSQTSSTRS